jgi:hypothetical protein
VLPIRVCGSLSRSFSFICIPGQARGTHFNFWSNCCLSRQSGLFGSFFFIVFCQSFFFLFSASFRFFLLSVFLSFLLLSNWFLFLSSFVFPLLFRHCFIPVSLVYVVSSLAYPNLLGTKRLGCCCCCRRVYCKSYMCLY